MICNVLMLTDYKKKTSAAKFQVTILFMMRMMFIVMILKMMT